MLSRQFIIETINDRLKSISQIVHIKHRSACIYVEYDRRIDCLSTERN
jgi:hypothetical protein